jgi:hypothetical protein
MGFLANAMFADVTKRRLKPLLSPWLRQQSRLRISRLVVFDEEVYGVPYEEFDMLKTMGQVPRSVLRFETYTRLRSASAGFQGTNRFQSHADPPQAQ